MAYDQIDYDELTITEDDSICEHRRLSKLGLTWSSSSSTLAQYLAPKDATIDPTFRLGRCSADTSDYSADTKAQKRASDEVYDKSSAKRIRNPDMLDITADTFKPTVLTNGNDIQDKEEMSFHSMQGQAALSRTNSCECPSIDELLSSIQSLSSISTGASHNAGTRRLLTYIVRDVTVLSIDIKGFTAQCAAMPAGRVGEWVAAFYERVDAAAAAHGVDKVEVRGDCCICVAGAQGRIPSRAVAAAGEEDRRDSQVTRMLAFAAALHSDLASLHAGGGSGPVTTTRMGVATGEAAFLVSSGNSDGAGFVSVQGNVVGLAAHMEAVAEPGGVYLHQSSAEQWAAETGRESPAMLHVAHASAEAPRAAVFDFAAGGFRGAARTSSAAASSAWGRGLKYSDRPAKLRRVASGPI